jgi:hypothetical protein
VVNHNGRDLDGRSLRINATNSNLIVFGNPFKLGDKFWNIIGDALMITKSTNAAARA